MKKYRCKICSHVYDLAEGDPASGVSAGTDLGNLPAGWTCPDCGATTEDYEPADWGPVDD